MFLIIGLGLVQAPNVGMAQTEAQPSAADKLKRVVESAWATGPDLAEKVAMVNAEAAAYRSNRGPGTPYVQFEMEGVQSQPNAQNYLRLGAPFDFPWQFTRGRRLGKTLDLWETTAIDAARLQVAHMVAGSWVFLAAIEERVQVEESRVNRMNQAVELQSQRLNLGEVAGMDVMQLELQRARDSSNLRALQAQRVAIEAYVRQLAGQDAPLPVAGDLERLAEDPSRSITGSDFKDIEEKIASGILYSSLFTRAEKEQLLSDLMGSTAWGRPEVQIEWEHVPELEGLPGFDAFGFAVSVPLPLGKRGGQQAAAARAEAEAASASLERGRRELVGRAQSALAAAQSATARLEESESVLERLPQTEFSLSEQFRLGSISYLVYIDGLARLDDLRLQRIESYETLVRARLELAAILGDSTLFPIPRIESHITREEN
jgi:outer membrane protein TolC